MQFKVNIQHDSVDCGPACLQMIAKPYGKRYDLQKIRELCFGNRNNTPLKKEIND
jgi:ATP-binding cassette subfamily B protein